MSAVSLTGVTKRFEDGSLGVNALDLDVHDGELLVLLGTAGSGKTTVVRMLAGLQTVTSGEISIGTRIVNDVVAKERDIAMVFESSALYPQLTVEQNIGYPLQLARMPYDKMLQRVVTVAEQLQLGQLLGCKPRQLSRRQRERVAIGRALVRDPGVLVMDEPFSNLDPELRGVLRGELVELQRALGTTMIYATDDPAEAMAIGTRVAVIHNGALQQVAPPHELYRSPANVFVAALVGLPPMNLLDCEIAPMPNGDVALASGGSGFRFPAATIKAHDAVATARGSVVAGIRPEDIRVCELGTGLKGVVKRVETMGSEFLVHVDIPGLEIHDPVTDLNDDPLSRMLAKSDQLLSSVGVGDVVGVHIDPAHVKIFDWSTGAALRPVASAEAR